MPPFADLPPSSFVLPPERPALSRSGEDLRASTALQRASFIPGMFPGGALGHRGTVQYKGTAVGTTTVNAGSNKTFSSCDFGAAHPDRYIIVAYSADAPTLDYYGSYPTVTIGGVTATGCGMDVSPDNLMLAFFVAKVPTGATGSIVINHAETQTLTQGIAWYRATGLGMLRPIQTQSSGIEVTRTVRNNRVDDTIPINGFAIVALNYWGSAVRTCTWASPSGHNFVETYDQAMEGNFTHHGALATRINGESFVAAQATMSGTNTYASIGMIGVWTYEPTEALKITFCDDLPYLDALTVYTHSNAAIGTTTTSKNRQLVVFVGKANTGDDTNSTPVSVTVGGRYATLVTWTDGTILIGGSGYRTGLSAWLVDTTGLGTTANIVVTFPQEQDSEMVVLYEVVGGVWNNAGTAVDSSSATPSGETVTSWTPGGGAFCGCIIADTPENSPSMSEPGYAARDAYDDFWTDTTDYLYYAACRGLRCEMSGWNVDYSTEAAIADTCRSALSIVTFRQAPPQYRKPTLRIEYIGEYHSATDIEDFTFTSVPLGTPSLDRWIIVAVCGSTANGDQYSGAVTIGGRYAVGMGTADTANSYTEFWICPVNDLLTTAADIVVETDYVHQRCSIAVWAVTGIASLFSDEFGEVDTTLSSNALSLSFTVPSGGRVFAAACFQGSSAGSVTWTNITERADVTVESNWCATYGDSEIAAGTRTAQFSATATQGDMVIMGYRADVRP